jgi:hypothetical protein
VAATVTIERTLKIGLKATSLLAAVNRNRPPVDDKKEGFMILNKIGG